MNLKIFIGHSSKDKEITDIIAKHLRFLDYEVWYDEELKGKGGADWWKDINVHIKQCNVFFYLYSQAAIGSKYCQLELDLAKEHRKYIIPVRVRDDIPIPGHLVDIQNIDLAGYSILPDLTEITKAVFIFEREKSRKSEWQYISSELIDAEAALSIGYEKYQTILAGVERKIRDDAVTLGDFPRIEFLECMASKSEEIKILQTWSSIVNEHEEELYKAIVENHASLQVLLLNPDSAFVQIRARLLGWEDNEVRNKICESIITLKKLNNDPKVRDRIKVKLYTNPPPFALHICNQRVYIGLFRPGAIAMDSTTYQLHLGRGVGDEVNKEFNYIWKTADDLNDAEFNC